MSPFLNPPYIIAVLIAISIHEWAHAFTATKLGDPTPHNEGRLTVNPIAHIDPLGALMFLVIGFGWAKPVPVNARYFRNPTRGLVLTALAGPFSNLVLALLSFIGLFLLVGPQHFAAEDLLGTPVGFSIVGLFFFQVLASSLFVNLALMAFNLFPIAPLDGSNIVRIFIPRQYEYDYEKFFHYGPYILLALIVAENFLPIHILSGWVLGIMGFVLKVFATII